MASTLASSASDGSSNVYSVGQAIDSLGFGRFQLWISAIVGFANVAEAMEMMILSILSPALHCVWHITQVQQATLTTVVFLGMMLSCPCWGILADRFGRRRTIIWSSLFLFYFGFLTSFAPSFGWILFLRFLVGVFIGGMPQACTLFIEYLPSSVRGQAILFLSFFWAIGSCFEALLAWLVMPTLGWRYLVGLSTLPLLLFVCLTPLLPESPMYLAITGKKDEVHRQLKQVAIMNRKPVVTGQLDIGCDGDSEGQDRGHFLDLFRSGRARLTLSVFFLWNVCACTYYGVVLLSTEMLDSSRDVCAADVSVATSTSNSTETCSVHSCQGLSASDYVSLIWTTFAEFPGTIVAMVLIDRVGRKKTMAIQAFLFAASTLLVLECGSNKTILVVALFAARGFTSGLFQTIYVYTPEVYPTKMRAVAMGFGSASARIGAMVTPYIAQVLLRTSLRAAVGVYATLGFAAAVVAWFLPVETLGQDLTQANTPGATSSSSTTSLSAASSAVTAAAERLAGAAAADSNDGHRENLVENMEENEREQQEQRTIDSRF